LPIITKILALVNPDKISIIIQIISKKYILMGIKNPMALFKQCQPLVFAQDIMGFKTPSMRFPSGIWEVLLLPSGRVPHQDHIHPSLRGCLLKRVNPYLQWQPPAHGRNRGYP
jgi:hypothetical protein